MKAKIEDGFLTLEPETTTEQIEIYHFLQKNLVGLTIPMQINNLPTKKQVEAHENKSSQSK